MQAWLESYHGIPASGNDDIYTILKIKQDIAIYFINFTVVNKVSVYNCYLGIKREELGGRGGSIQSAITLEIPSEYIESLNLKLG